jgi:hypothetical protein
MIRRNGRPVISPGRRGVAGLAAVALLGGFGLAGCGLGKAVSAVKKVTDNVAANKATVDEFASSMKSAATTFEATYVTTGTSPTTVIYAVRPPKELAFSETPSAAGASNGLSAADLVVNSSGEYSCTPPSTGSGSHWSCQKLGTAGAATRNQILGLYTPAHWVAFLRGFSVAAGFAGDKVSSSHLTVNGFSMRCVDFVATGVAGTSKICTTAQGVLGYVKVASNSASFEIKSYSTSPRPSLFRLPPGATITAPAKGTT